MVTGYEAAHTPWNKGRRAEALPSFGFFLAAIVNALVGAHDGWRAMCAVGGTPALLVAFIQYGVSESKRWERRVGELGGRWTMRKAFAALFSRELGAGITSLVGAGVSHFHSIGTPVALTAVAFAVGWLPLPSGEETKGKMLPVSR